MASLVSGTSGNLRWQVLGEWESLLLGPDGLRLEEWKRLGHAKSIKDGPHRSVYLVQWGDRAFYVKHRRPNRWTDVAGHFFRASTARREWRKAAELTRRGVPTVRPIAWQERIQSGVVWESFLVTEAIDGVCSLDDFVARRLAKLPPSTQRRTRRRLIRGLARFTASIHRAGVLHDDFHSGNILVGPSCSESESQDTFSLHLIDVPGVRFSGPLTWSQSRDGLVVLDSAWQERTSVNERLSFWQTYLKERPELGLPDRRTALAEIEQAGRRHARKIARRRDRRALGTNRDYVARARFGREAHAVADLTKAELAQLWQEPEDLLWQNLARPVKLGHSCQAVRGSLWLDDGKVRVLTKRYRPRNAWKRLAARLRRGRALRSWLGGCALATRRIPTARPLGVCQIRSGPQSGYGYLLTEWIDGAENVHLYARQLAARPEADRFRQAARCADSLGGLVGRMHSRGIVHGDLKAANLLVVEREECVETYVIDTDDVRVMKHPAVRRQEADLARLSAVIEGHPWITRSMAYRFVRAYCEQFAGSEIDWKRLWRRTASRSRRAGRRKKRRGSPIL